MVSTPSTSAVTARSHVWLHGRDVAYLDLPGQGTPVVLVHGIGSTADTWGDTPMAFGSGHPRRSTGHARSR